MAVTVAGIVAHPAALAALLVVIPLGLLPGGKYPHRLLKYQTEAGHFSSTSNRPKFEANLNPLSIGVGVQVTGSSTPRLTRHRRADRAE